MSEHVLSFIRSVVIAYAQPPLCFQPRGVQQVKLEFVETSRLANPDENGDCNTDSFTVVSGTSTVDSLRVCGNLTGQHSKINVSWIFLPLP